MGEGKKESRQRMIIELLNKRESVELSELCQQFSCCPTTMRNDLRELEAKKKLLRTFGGATRLEPKSIKMRSECQRLEKYAIAEYCVKHFIEPGDTISIDSGSTCEELAVALAASELAINVVTNSFQAAMHLTHSKCISLHLVGGRYNADIGSFLDENSEQIMGTMRTNTYFFSAKGVSSQEGYFISDSKEVSLKRKMVQCAERTIALMDYTKMGETAFKLVCETADIGTIVTDWNTSDQIIDGFRTAGIEVIRVEKPNLEEVTRN